MCGHILTVSFANNAKSSRVCVGDIGDGVSIERGLVSHGANFLDGRLDGDASGRGEGHFERFFVAQRDVGAGTQASRVVLGSRGGVEWQRSHCLWGVLVQPLKGNNVKQREVVNNTSHHLIDRYRKKTCHENHNVFMDDLCLRSKEQSAVSLSKRMIVRM